MSLQKIGDLSTAPSCCESYHVKVGIYTTAVTVVALAVIFGVLVLLTQYCSLHLGCLDGTMKKIVDFLGEYSFIPLAASSGIWTILVGAGIYKGCSEQPPQDGPHIVLSDPSEDNPGDKLESRRPLVALRRNDAAYQRMDALLEENQLDAAWNLYLDDSYFGKKGYTRKQNLILDNYLPQDGWTYLPPEKLLNAAIDRWLSEGGIITEKVCPEFIRACAMGYRDFRDKCLKEDRLWSCFAGCQECIADIAIAHPSFGAQVMISPRGLDIMDHHRMEIFQASYKNLLPLIAAGKLDDENMKFLAMFLLCHERAIDKSEFDRIQEINHALVQQMNTYPLVSREHQNYFFHVALMDLVEGKLYFQGVYEKRGVSPLPPPLEIDVVDQVFLSDWIEGVARKLSMATDEASIRKGLLYLSLIQESSPSYSDAQMALGHIWMDLDNFSEAGACFLKVAKLKNEYEADAVMLAALCLLAYSDTRSTHLLRIDMENFNGRILNLKECKSFTLETLLNKIASLKKNI